MREDEETGFPEIIEPDELPPAFVSPFNGPVELHEHEHHGSNVDLDEYASIDEELRTVPHMLDAALSRYERASRELLNLRYAHRLRWAHALEKAGKRAGSATEARALAELEVRGALLEIESATLQADVASRAIAIFGKRLSAAQTRARKWIAQYESDVRGKAGL